jgi:poly(A) polymerase
MGDLRRGAERVASVLREAGHQALFAGGCVRDLLLGLEPKDYDVVTDARPERIAELFRHTRQIGASFGVVQVRLRGQVYEVATFRTEGAYSDGRRPDAVAYTDRMEEDIERRDFTINALLMDPVTEEVIDLVQGQHDLRAGIIRAVGDPERRFGEDRLRMLRAVRFAARFGFVIEPSTAAAIRRHAAELRDVSVERIAIELEGVFASARPEHGMVLLESLGLARPALPFLPGAAEVRRCRYEPFAAAEWRRLDARRRSILGWAFLFADDAPRAVEASMRALRLSKDHWRGVQRLLTLRPTLRAPTDPAEVRRIVADEDLELVLAYADAIGGDVVTLARTRDELAHHPLPSRPILSGHDLMALGVVAGPALKTMLAELDREVLARRITGPEAARAWVRDRMRAAADD